MLVAAVCKLLAPLLLTACHGGGSGAPLISAQPRDAIVIAPAAATFAVTAAGSGPLGYQWQKNGSDITGANAASYTTPATSPADNRSTYRVIVSNSAGSATSAAATLTVTTSVSGTDVLTYHNDAARTGQNLTETVLTPANVSAASFGKLGFYAVDGKVDAQPLVVSALAIGGGRHNVLYVATEHDSIYALDADTGARYWTRTLLGANESTSGDHGCDQVQPEIGITATPVIDRAAGTIYLVAMSLDTTGSYHQRLHALDLASGAEKAGSPVEVQATTPGSSNEGNTDGLTVRFLPGQHKERMALTLVNGTIYTSWSSHCDGPTYTGWIIAYQAGSLAQTAVLSPTPNGGGSYFGGALWSSNTGPAVDSAGNLYIVVSNGLIDATLDANGFPSQQNYGNALIKVSTANNTLAITDYFAMWNAQAESDADEDFGSGGAVVLPDQVDVGGRTRHLVVAAGKDDTLHGVHNIYLADRDNLGKINVATQDNRNVYQVVNNGLGSEEYGMPAYFNGTLYYGAQNDVLRAFSYSAGRLSPLPTSVTAHIFGYPGTTPSISANGSTNGILWALDSGQGSPGVLHAYDAANLARELYNSTQAAAGRDAFGNGNKFITPTIANGKVYVATPGGVAVFGLLSP